MINLTSKNARHIAQIAKLQAKKELAKTKFIHYLELTHHGIYKRAPHTELIAEALDRIERGECKRLMVFLPPRHSKSMTISETFPSYYISKKPDRRVILSCYGDHLANKFGRMNRQKLDEFGSDLFDVEINSVNASVQNWGIQGNRGGMISAGIMGTITGEGADLLIIDDIIKNRQEANSQTYRQRVWDEWQNTLVTRLHPGGAVILIMTRWHEDDLAGRLLKQEKEKWDVITLPAEAEDNDPLGREPGQPLWASHGFDEQWIAEKKKEVGTQTWISLYQQRPSAEAGMLFKRNWWNFYKKRPNHFDEVIQSWDCTFKDADTSDYVVGQVWGRLGADKYLLDQVRGRMDINATMTAIRTLSKKWKSARRKLVEDKANGPAVISMLKREISGMIPIQTDGGKVVRAQAVSPDVEAGNVYLPDPEICEWIHDYIEEFSVFPNGKHDDQVDSTTQALNHFGQSSPADIF